MEDIYFEPLYGKISEKLFQGKSEVFLFENTSGIIRHMFIKREISQKIKGETYYDLIGPYGYGGPIIERCDDPNKIKELVTGFYNSFSEYCKQNKIVSEYVTFHPILANQKDFKSIYDVRFHKKTRGTNLLDFEDPFITEFSSAAQKTVRRAIRAGVTYKITSNPTDINIFKEIYWSTMKRKSAVDFYYFDKQYFDDFLRLMRECIILIEAIYEGKTIAAGFYFKYKKIIHTHLSGTLDEYLHLSPAYILKYGITRWGKENGYSLIHHGGGLSNNEDDPLYIFKKRFSKNTEFELYKGAKVWNKEIYEYLCLLNCERQIEQDGFFPAYRRGDSKKE